MVSLKANLFEAWFDICIFLKIILHLQKKLNKMLLQKTSTRIQNMCSLCAHRGSFAFV